MTTEAIVNLGQMTAGDTGQVVGIEASAPEALARRLLEFGVLEGEAIEVMHEAPFGRDPIAVQVRGTLVALRRHEARYVSVKLTQGRSK